MAARASAWAKTVEKLRSRQMALKQRAATLEGTRRTASSPQGTYMPIEHPMSAREPPADTLMEPKLPSASAGAG